MILDDFTLHNITFQIQYGNAYLIWDRAGSIASAITKIWPNVELTQGQPQQQILSGGGVQIQTGINSSTASIVNSKALDQLHTKRLKDTLDVWVNEMQLEEINRISCKATFIKSFETLKESNSFIFKRNLVTWPSERVFDQPIESDNNSADISYKFEDEKSFAFVRIKAEQLRFDAELDPYFVDEPHISKTKNRVVLEFDRGHLGKVDVRSIRVDEWLKGFQHLLRRDIEKVIGRRIA